MSILLVSTVSVIFRRTVSRHQSQPLSPDVLHLRDMVSEFASTKPFDYLEVVTTLGVGGFGRVELVRNSHTAVSCQENMQINDKRQLS